MSELCRVCRKPATGAVNVTASAASSVPSVMEPRCDEHSPYRIAVIEVYDCTICEKPIDDGYMYGDGDGSGRRFVHPRCYHERSLREGNVEQVARAERWFAVDREIKELAR